MNELEFTAETASWINEMLLKVPIRPFSRAKCEQTGRGSRKRRDLTLLDRDQRPVLTGEVKLPYQKDGGSPYNAAVVRDARSKAQRAGVNFFFTWNINEFVLWETAHSEAHWTQRNYKAWQVTSIHRESHLELPMTIHAIKVWLTLFLHEFAQIIRGTAIIGFKPPDEKFIDALESSLRMPVLLNFDELSTLYQQDHFRRDLDDWMRNQQGWIIYSDPEGIRENLTRASQFACYALVNKLVFCEALLKRYSGAMDKPAVPDHIDTGEGLRGHLQRYFSDAENITGDYETVFGVDYASIGNRIPFYSNEAVSYWRDLINQVHQFDFSKLDYEIIGSIFERLISPEERHKFGQYYTRVEVVDLINSFCIRDGDEKVMDPACGGGTFLVRAYVRKRELAQSKKHRELISDLYGLDVSDFATHLTTINLATRDLVDEENYPQVARNDFFNISVHDAIMELPRSIKTKGLGAGEQRKVQVPLLDAVVGNPPYVRQEDIRKSAKSSNGNPQPGTKEFYWKRVKEESGVELSKRSDILCYFWPHSARFLGNGGYLCFLTSSQWLDVEYGFRLQEWILSNFEMVAVFESIEEPWFVGARVATAITVLKRQPISEKRMQNIVRFVQLRKPIREILIHDGTTAGAIVAADRFRNEILGLQQSVVNDRYRARLVRQRDIWEQGVRLGVMLGKTTEPEDDNASEVGAEYYGGKWGIYLRAPDLWFELLDDYGDKFAPLGDIAEVKFGVKSGKDSFFFPKDCSSQCLQREADDYDFEATYSVARRDVASGKVKLVRCGEGRGEIRPIESKYLEPEIHSLMEVKGYQVSAADCARLILLVGGKRRKIKDKFVLDYIRWGESQGYHESPTCASRVTRNREWFDLTNFRRAPVLWPQERQYRHIVPANPEGLIANHHLYTVFPPKDLNDPNQWGGILNSTWVLLSSRQFGRPVGNEGNWSTMVVDVNMMLVPDPRKASRKSLEKVAKAFQELKDRQPLQMLSEMRLTEMRFRSQGKERELRRLSYSSELDCEDRRKLDDAVLAMLGVGPRNRRKQLIENLYRYLGEYFELVRRKEEKAIINKTRYKRRGVAKPKEIAEQIYKEILDNEGYLLKRYDGDFLNRSKPYDTFDIPEKGTPQPLHPLFVKHGVDFRIGKKSTGQIEVRTPGQIPLIVLLADAGLRGLVRVPHEEEECHRVHREYADFVFTRNRRIMDLIEERTSDEELREKIYEELIPKFCLYM